MSAPTCSECLHGTITEHSSKDKCKHALNANGYPPYALRHDETLCGSTAVWFEVKPLADVVYKAKSPLAGVGG